MARSDDAALPSLTREDIWDAVFQFLELTAIVDGRMSETAAWPTVAGSQKSADRAALKQLEGAVRGMIGVRRRYQRTMVTARAAAAVCAIVKAERDGRCRSAGDVQRIWNAECPLHLPDIHAADVWKALSKSGDRLRGQDPRTRREAVISVAAKVIRKSKHTLAGYIPKRSGSDLDELVQLAKRQPRFLGSPVEVERRESVLAFEFVLAQVLGWPKDARARSDLVARYDRWWESWQLEGAWHHFLDAWGAPDKTEAAVTYLEKFPKPRSALVDPREKGEAFTVDEDAVEDLASGQSRTQAREHGRSSGDAVVRPRSVPLWTAKEMEEAITVAEEQGGLPPQAEVIAAWAAASRWFAGHPAAVLSHAGEPGYVVFEPRVTALAQARIMRWRVDGEVNYEAFVSAESKGDGTLAVQLLRGGTLRFATASDERVEQARDAERSIWPRQFQTWKRPDDTVVLTAAQAESAIERGLLGADAVPDLQFSAESQEEAEAISRIRLGLEPFLPRGFGRDCPFCGRTYYPEGSGECWHCHWRQ